MTSFYIGTTDYRVAKVSFLSGLLCNGTFYYWEHHCLSLVDLLSYDIEMTSYELIQLNHTRRGSTMTVMIACERYSENLGQKRV